MSIEQEIQEAMANLDQEISEKKVMLYGEDPLKLEVLRKGIDKIHKPNLGYKEISDFVSLCLYYEDLYHRRPDVISKTLVKSAAQELLPKVDVFEDYVDELAKFNQGADDYSQELNRKIQILDEQINELQNQLGL
ncbi:hypothetical protein TVAG_297460 [Trichomonas vaginalis G3]|uniref:Uncharacterized protein n=1 Tax=Trichomonas vaginalis (strain ATCC PRA-98 / G3) TaxID=412133 RepID=A2DRE1_TRIV3|nr:hypothetical protein TVAGG3_0513290 [Trichomonas vaginalis G3]EAY17067.1 hypothetical protein TVAG_297460 [Trichomonas vaginalis G3]KAI5517939.1 hypothetical protein TVAGG3_0513290 [Trichomonas vaginalis G3]|eukprot:XP_001329290.1 hypothetical protein [Trichomonas vaginalis G3]